MNPERKIIELQKDLTWLNKFAKELRNKRFFGKIELIYQNGKIVNCNQLESIKPEKDN